MDITYEKIQQIAKNLNVPVNELEIEINNNKIYVKKFDSVKEIKTIIEVK